MKRQTLIITLGLLLGSCASLTKTQIGAVNQFSQASKNFSAYPSRVMTALAEIRVKRGVYFANTLDSPKLHINELDKIYQARKNSYKYSAKVDTTFKIIDKYAQSLMLLSSEKYVSDLKTQANNFGVDLDSLIKGYNSIEGVKQVPAGIGGAINKLIVLGGKQYVRSKQAKEIKKFVPAADSLISVMTTNLLEFLQSKNIQFLVKNEEEEVNSNYLSFLRQRQPGIENERDYLDLKSNIDAIKQLRDQTVAATKHLRRAHKKLLLAIQRRKTLKETIPELQDLYEDVKEINTTIEVIKSSKN
ncbi:MAG: hypothetical protein ABI707_14140 [Ferruginibacter sp.]